jgi:hypothetical protein
MKKQPTMNWNDRFAVIDSYSPSDSQITSVFNVTQAELDTARSLRATGTFSANVNTKVAKFAPLFGVAETTTHTVVRCASGDNKTATVHVKPESATKKVKVPQKRGRKGNLIEQAFRAVTETPVRVDLFMAQYHVSLPVLRQSKRFIEALGATIAEQIGTIEVKQDKTTKQLVIYKRPAPTV